MEYSIGEVAKILGITPSTLRYYDKEGLLPLVNRTPSGIRTFNQDDLGLLRLVQCLKASGLSIKDIKQFVDWTLLGDETIEERRDMFHRQKAHMEKKMAEMEKTYNAILYKCWFYETACNEGTTDFDHSLTPQKVIELKQNSRLHHEEQTN